MGMHAAGIPTRVFAGLGLGLLIVMAADTAINKLPKTIREYRARLQQSHAVDQDPERVANLFSPGIEGNRS